MQERVFVSAKEFCTHHKIEFGFIHSLRDYGLIEGSEAEEDYLLPQEELETLEKLVRLHFDLRINFEGLDVVHNLLEQMNTMQREILSLRNRLRLYEDAV